MYVCIIVILQEISMTLKLDGQIFGNLTVIHKQGRLRQSSVWRTTWLCKCLCGKITVKTTDTLRSGRTKSCGICEWHIHHKDAYISWMGMKQRCNTVSCKDYKSYGGRGINYDPRWENFAEFYKDMGDPPLDEVTEERLSLDRIDNSGNYHKDNCRWATGSQQQLNKGKLQAKSLQS